MERGAILEAAWASRAAERLASTKRTERGRGRADDDRDGDATIEAASTGTSGSSSSSKGGGKGGMFQSVMSRTVGSNGRIFGAYPNDALPIEEYSNERGVLDLARRYGYGNWRENHLLEDEEDSEEDDDNDGLWGGALSFGKVDDGEDEFEPEVSLAARKTSGSQKRRRRKKKFTSVSPIGDVDDIAVKTAARRKRKSKSSKSVALGLSGGGTAVETTLSRKSRFTFEVGINASTSNGMMQQQTQMGGRRSAILAATTLPSASSSRQRNSSAQIQTHLQRHSTTSMRFTSNANIKAPMQLLNEMNERLEKIEEDGLQ